MRPMRSSLKQVWPIALSFAAVSVIACSEADRTRWKARFGDADAQIAVGTAYAQGDGGAKDAGEGAIGYRKAAKQRRAEAAGAPARLYASGDLAADPDQALHWFEVEAAASGREVQFALAKRLD